MTATDQPATDQPATDQPATDHGMGTGLVAGTTPYPWPYDVGLARSRLALVVVGWNTTWWQRCVRPEQVVAPINRLAAALDHVVVVDHEPRACVNGPTPSRTDGAPPALQGARVIGAAGIDGFFGGPLDTVLRRARRDLLLLVGLGLETTVHSTMRSANDRGYECLLVIDACASHDPDAVPYATSMVEMSGGIFGAVGTSDHVLAALGENPFSGGTR